MTWQVNIDSKYSGWKGITQIIAATFWTEPNPGLVADVTNCVDGNEFYRLPSHYYTNNPSAEIILFDDFPQVPIGTYSGELLFSSADDYVRFKPGTDPNDGNIYVTLGIVHWQAHGRYNNLTSTLTDNYTPEATGPDNNDAFPVWDELFPDEQQ